MANPATTSRFVTFYKKLRPRLATLGGAAVAGAVLLGPGPMVSAQSLPPVSTERLSASQQTQVRQYVESRLDALENGDPASSEAARARRELIEPMRDRSTSVAMRQAFAEASAERLQAMARSEDDQLAVSALLVAGNIGDRQSVAIIQAGLRDEREAVQIGASAGAKAMLRILDARLGGAQAERQREVQRIVGDTLAVTRSGHVAQSLVGALTALPEDLDFMRLSSELIADAMVGQAVSRRRGLSPAEALSGGWAGAFERSIAAQQSFQRAAAIAGADVDREAQLQGARLAGIVLSLVRDLLNQGGDAGEAEQVLADHARLLRVGETALVLVESSLTARQPRPQEMGDLITSADIEGVGAAIDRWVGRSGILTAAPFSFRASDFER